MKAQALIVQFLLFFLIGFSIFLLIGNVFSFHSLKFGSEIREKNLKMIGSLLSSVVINLYTHESNYSTIKLFFSNFSQLKDFQVILTQEGMEIISPENLRVESSIHNLNESLGLEGDSNLESIIFTYKKKDNKIVIS